MFTAIQCQKPLPVGASGSYMVTAKLLVPAGGFDHFTSGETFCPVQPMMLAMYFGGKVPSAGNELLEISNADAGAVAAINAAAAMPKHFASIVLASRIL
jgi:hypothetical protein